MGNLELTRLPYHCPGERTLFVPEQLGFEQCLGNRGTVDGNERPPRARAECVQHTRKELLVRAAFSFQQHRRIRAGRALSQATECDRREGQPCQSRKVQEVIDHLAERLGLLPDTLDVRQLASRQPVEIQEPTVTMNRGEAVAEFVRESCRQLAEPGQAVFESELLLQIDDGRQIGEQTDNTLKRSRPIEHEGH